MYSNKKLSTKDVDKIADFVLQSNLFEFNSKFYKQISGNAIGTKFTPLLYATLKWDFRKNPWFWKKFINRIFFIWKES